MDAVEFFQTVNRICKNKDCNEYVEIPRDKDMEYCPYCGKRMVIANE